MSWLLPEAQKREFKLAVFRTAESRSQYQPPSAKVVLGWFGLLILQVLALAVLLTGRGT